MTAFVTSLLAALASAPLIRRLGLRAGLLDVPNHRSSHSLPTPRVGGLACVMGVLVAAVGGQFLGQDVAWPLIAGATFLGAVGLADDRISLSAVVRLLSQVLVGAACGAAIGGPALAAAGAILVPTFVNMVNFMDGINAISSLTVALWGGTAFFAASASPLHLIGAVTAGAALGFLPWNTPVARLFLGDVGSYFLGTLVGLGVVLGIHEHVEIAVLLAPLTVYALDTGITLLRRASRGERLLDAHRDHIYQQLVNDHGLPHLAVAVGSAAVALAITLAWAHLGALLASAVTLALCAAYLGSPVVLSRRQEQ